MARLATVAFCDECWKRRHGEKVPVKVSPSLLALVKPVKCHGCGGEWSGIWCRWDVEADPPHPKSLAKGAVN